MDVVFDFEMSLQLVGGIGYQIDWVNLVVIDVIVNQQIEIDYDGQVDQVQGFWYVVGYC